MYTHVALLLRPEAAPAQSLVVRADAIVDDGDSVSLWREGRCVHRVAARLVLEAAPFANARDAEQHLLTFRTRGVGGATVHVAELTPPARSSGRSAGGVPAEGVRVVVER